MGVFSGRYAVGMSAAHSLQSTVRHFAEIRAYQEDDKIIKSQALLGVLFIFRL